MTTECNELKVYGKDFVESRRNVAYGFPPEGTIVQNATPPAEGNKKARKRGLFHKSAAMCKSSELLALMCSCTRCTSSHL